MDELRYQIAGLPVALRAVTPGAIDDVAPVYRTFATAAEPRLVIEVERGPRAERPRTPEYPAFRRTVLADGRVHVERYDADGEIAVDGRPLVARFRIGPSPNSLDACVRIATSLALPRTGAIILHASAVQHAGRALVFTGHSGAGKSTLSSLLPAVSAACEKIGDELIVIAPDDGGWQVVIPPYLGRDGVPHGARAPLASIDVLVQAPFERRTRLAPAEAIRAVLRNTLVYVAEPRTAERVLAIAGRLALDVPCSRLEFRKDPAVASVLGVASPEAADPARLNP